MWLFCLKQTSHKKHTQKKLQFTAWMVSKVESNIHHKDCSHLKLINNVKPDVAIGVFA